MDYLLLILDFVKTLKDDYYRIKPRRIGNLSFSVDTNDDLIYVISKGGTGVEDLKTVMLNGSYDFKNPVYLKRFKSKVKVESGKIHVGESGPKKPLPIPEKKSVSVLSKSNVMAKLFELKADEPSTSKIVSKEDAISGQKNDSITGVPTAVHLAVTGSTPPPEVAPTPTPQLLPTSTTTSSIPAAQVPQQQSPEVPIPPTPAPQLPPTSTTTSTPTSQVLQQKSLIPVKAMTSDENAPTLFEQINVPVQPVTEKPPNKEQVKKLLQKNRKEPTIDEPPNAEAETVSKEDATLRQKNDSIMAVPTAVHLAVTGSTPPPAVAPTPAPQLPPTSTTTSSIPAAQVHQQQSPATPIVVPVQQQVPIQETETVTKEDVTLRQKNDSIMGVPTAVHLPVTGSTPPPAVAPTPAPQLPPTSTTTSSIPAAQIPQQQSPASPVVVPVQQQQVPIQESKEQVSGNQPDDVSDQKYEMKSTTNEFVSASTRKMPLKRKVSEEYGNYENKKKYKIDQPKNDLDVSNTATGSTPPPAVAPTPAPQLLPTSTTTSSIPAAQVPQQQSPASPVVVPVQQQEPIQESKEPVSGNQPDDSSNQAVEEVATFYSFEMWEQKEIESAAKTPVSTPPCENVPKKIEVSPKKVETPKKQDTSDDDLPKSE
uniref:Uncharacterized protein n=1 Tax=Panagrolaimus sp. JU765 TaxID=591449 RepID=A0AC34RAZ7_9BILA